MQAGGNLSVLLIVELDRDVSSLAVPGETTDLARFGGFLIGGVYSSIEIKLLIDSFSQSDFVSVHLHWLQFILLSQCDGWEEGDMGRSRVRDFAAGHLTGWVCRFTCCLSKRWGGGGWLV